MADHHCSLHPRPSALVDIHNVAAIAEPPGVSLGAFSFSGLDRSGLLRYRRSHGSQP